MSKNVIVEKKNSIDAIINEGQNDTKLLDREFKIFNPYRILILKLMYLHDIVEFHELKLFLTANDPTDKKITDGNLVSHLNALINVNLVTKEVVLDEKQKRKTFYALSEVGRLEFVNFASSIKGVLNVNA